LSVAEWRVKAMDVMNGCGRQRSISNAVTLATALLIVDTDGSICRLDQFGCGASSIKMCTVSITGEADAECGDTTITFRF